MKIVAIIQTRMRSTRLPGKVLKLVNGHPLLFYTVHRTALAPSISKTIVATTVESIDDPIHAYCAEELIPCYRGSEENVLDRHYQVAKMEQADVVVRITSDCPLTDPAVIEYLVQVYLSSGCDYVRTGKTWPNGVGSVEVFSFTALEKAWERSTLKSEKEHATPHIYTHPDEFSIQVVEYTRNCEHIKLSVDYPEQLEIVRSIVQALDNDRHDFTTADILQYLDEHPSLLESIQHIERRGPDHCLKHYKTDSVK